MFSDLLSLEVNLGLFYGALLVGVALFAGGLRNKTLGQYGKSSHQVFYIIICLCITVPSTPTFIFSHS